MGTSLLVQGLHTSTAGSMGPIPSQGTKILHTTWCGGRGKHTLLIKQITGQIWSDGHSLKILGPPITNKFSRIFHSPFVFSGCDLEVNLIILLFFLKALAIYLENFGYASGVMITTSNIELLLFASSFLTVRKND